MGKKKTPVPAAQVVKRYDIGELCRKHKVPAWERDAMRRQFGWVDGKRVTADEFAAARDEVQHRRF